MEKGVKKKDFVNAVVSSKIQRTACRRHRIAMRIERCPNDTHLLTGMTGQQPDESAELPVEQ